MAPATVARRIVHVTAPAPYGGLERVVLALAAGQQRRGHAVTVLAIVEPGPAQHAFVRAARQAGLAVESVAVAAVSLNTRAYLRERGAVAARCRALGAELIHTHGYRADVIDSSVARRLGVPRVTTVHGFTAGGWRNRLYELLQRRAFRGFDAVVAVSTPMARQLVESGVQAERVHVVRNAWAGAATLPRSAARTALELPAAAPVLGWVGRLSREKAFDVLLDALPLLSDAAVRVCVIGDGVERAHLSDRAMELGVAERIAWQGPLENAGTLFRAFDVFVLSSRTEGTPISLLEAMAAEVPVVATAVGGVPDVVTAHEALLVPPESPRALAEAIRRTLADPSGARTRAEAACRRLQTDFALEPWLDAYDHIYGKVVGAARLR